ncbi:MAG: ParM/StbA family protein, partial [Nostoc sp.]
GIGNRMADVWALYQYMIIQFDELTGYTRSEVVLLTKSAEGSTDEEVKPKYNFTPCERPSTFIAVNENV